MKMIQTEAFPDGSVRILTWNFSNLAALLIWMLVMYRCQRYCRGDDAKTRLSESLHETWGTNVQKSQLSTATRLCTNHVLRPDKWWHSIAVSVAVKRLAIQDGGLCGASKSVAEAGCWIKGKNVQKCTKESAVWCTFTCEHQRFRTLAALWELSVVWPLLRPSFFLFFFV